MKQKYLILKDSKNKLYKIQEFAELDKEMLSLLCEESYDYSTIKSALSTGKNALIAALRTNNLYPPRNYAEKIAEAVANLHESKDLDTVELLFDDIEMLAKDRENVVDRAIAEVDEDIDEEAAELDELLDDDIEDGYQEKGDIKKMDSSLKVADDEFVDNDDDV